MAPCRAAMKNPPAGGLVKKKPAGRRAKGSEEDSEETLAEKPNSKNSGEAWLRHHQTPQPAAYPLLTLINGCKPFRRGT